MDTPSSDPIERVLRYHVRTKHHFHRYARSLGVLDWANQPDPFRRFDGAPLIPLPLLSSDDDPGSPTYEAIFQFNAVSSQPVTIRSVSRFLELSLGLSAWKRAGETQWALRNNPSSGNLHPTEGYVVLPAIDTLDLAPGVYHYAVKEHGLEQRAQLTCEQSARLMRAFPPAAFLLGLTSVHWRESWKYGERAFRYCHHDVGHAVGASRIAAATLGWRLLLLDGMNDAAIGSVLGTARHGDFEPAEPEHPDILAVVWPISDHHEATSLPLALHEDRVKELVDAPWRGRANRLSRNKPVPWDIIDDVAAATRKTTIECPFVPSPPHGRRSPSAVADRREIAHQPRAAQIIRRRRSAVAFDGKTSITADTLYRILLRLLPCAERPYLERPMPWDALPWDPAIHLALFVHRVDGLTPGLYVFVRDPSKLGFLQKSMNPEFEWTLAPGCPQELPLYWLLQGDARAVAAQVSCHQDIAGDSAFSLGMLAEFEGLLRAKGAWWYPRLFWEAGLVGQVLYLEAEAADVRGTGIGCFFDDAVHDLIGIRDLTLQSLYHFTIGGPVEDHRLQTLSPYHHLPPRS